MAILSCTLPEGSITTALNATGARVLLSVPSSFYATTDGGAYDTDICSDVTSKVFFIWLVVTLVVVVFLALVVDVTADCFGCTIRLGVRSSRVGITTTTITTTSTTDAASTTAVPAAVASEPAPKEEDDPTPAAAAVTPRETTRTRKNSNSSTSSASSSGRSSRGPGYSASHSRAVSAIHAALDSAGLHVAASRRSSVSGESRPPSPSLSRGNLSLVCIDLDRIPEAASRSARAGGHVSLINDDDGIGRRMYHSESDQDDDDDAKDDDVLEIEMMSAAAAALG